MTGGLRRPEQGGAATPAQKANAQAVLQASYGQLELVRSAAAKWQAGLAGLAGGITLFGVVKSRSDIASLADSWPIWCGVLLAAALLATVAGGYLAMRAAFGLPRATRTASFDARTDDHNRAVAALLLLRRAIAATLIAVGSFAVAIAIVWFAPTSGEPKLEVTPQTGTGACGTVVSLNAGVLTLETASGEQRFQIDELRALASVDACP